MPLQRQGGAHSCPSPNGATTTSPSSSSSPGTPDPRAPGARATQAAQAAEELERPFTRQRGRCILRGVARDQAGHREREVHRREHEDSQQSQRGTKTS